MKTIGVLGGLGPQATMDFESRLHRAAQRVIPPSLNSGYPPMVVYYYRFVPFITNDDGSRVLPLRPDPRLVDAAEKIGGMADFVVITSNFLHTASAPFRLIWARLSGRASSSAGRSPRRTGVA